MAWQPQSQWGVQNLGPQDLAFGMGNSGGMGATGMEAFPSTAMAAPAASSGFQLGWNMPTFQMGMQGLSSLGNLWGAFQANKLAKDQLNFTKNFANRNLANQTAAYNTALEDRSRARAAVEGQTSAEAAAYVNKNRLPTGG